MWGRGNDGGGGQVIYRASHPFCKIREHEVKQLQKLADIKKGFDVMIRDLKQPKWRDRISNFNCFKEYNSRRMEYIRERDLAADRKKDWWKKIRIKYNIGDRPAIVHMQTGNIILGETKENIDKEGGG